MDQVKKALSGSDILSYFNDKPNIVKYSDIHKYKSIYELLGKNKMCVLLYMTNINFGHWCCVYEDEHKGKIFFFDSYGIIPDDELKFVPKEMNQILKQEHNILTKLMYESNKPVEYNEYRLQKFGKDINTCGRWVIVRLQHKNISVDEFARLFLSKKEYIEPDILITYLTT